MSAKHVLEPPDDDVDASSGLRSRWLDLARGLLGLLAWGVLLVTIAVTFPRLIDPPNYRVAQLATAAPIGFFTGLVSILLFLVLASSPGRRRLVLIVAAAVSVALTALHTLWLAPLFVGSVPKAETGERLVLLAQNFEYGDANALADVVQGHRVDILVLVDLTPSQFKAVMSSSIPQQFPSSRDRHKTFTHTLIFSRYPLQHEEPISPAGASRSTDVISPQLGTFTLAAVHPAPPYIDNTANWHGEYRLIASAFRRHFSLRAGVPLIAAGDFNASADLKPFRGVLLEGELRDVIEERNAGWQPTFRAGGMPLLHGVVLPPIAQIDHVLVSRQIVATSVQTIHVPGSDHNGLLVRIARAAK